ncbi:ferredoxin III, nif-specific [Rhodomicrobium sp. Az07]|uniref:ferredoxin III, nif-specific n=1 Tax=Rhodomicrobium sp. Az07 TaxID=2839034 RepID=UPI001BE9F942|nr:ferredoxin III, nif-specific [Rhodomicrobium sp. Az07]MBT3070528.1 ferredoxin III, nif-specific [Rhodomicrobium sp. Az07]
MANLTRDGREWEPQFLIEINPETCIGCGRCFKVCDRSVMTLKGITDEGELVTLDGDDDEDCDDEFERKIMVLSDAGNCIGCSACHRVCPRACQTFSTTPPAL